MKLLWTQLKNFLRMLDSFMGGADRVTPRRKQTRYTYTNGPMYFLGQQIVRAMQDAGYPAKIHTCYRSAEEQQVVYSSGKSFAKPYQSAHQYWLAVDIIHATKGWPETGDAFWEALAAAVRVVEEKFDVALTHGMTDWGWDYAHVEMTDFRQWREMIGKRHVDQDMLNVMFQEELPKVWKQYQKRTT